MGAAGRLLVIWWACTLPAQPQGALRCRGCHQQIADSFQKTGMGRSFARPAMENTPLLEAPFYHAPSDSYFVALARGGAYFQRRYQLDAEGRQINVMEKRIDYVMGSGRHARAYLHRTPADTLIELPLGWYAEKGGYWAMNPGFDRADHDGFRRLISYDCMFCHNAYPRVPAAHEKLWMDPVYPAQMPEGIDCERCHGPGTRHIELAGRPGTRRELVRGAIVNPARLAPERQMEICMACHLETTSFPLPNAIRRFERGPFSFRPGEPLANFILNFDHAPEAGRQDKFEFVSSAYRLRQSACFLKSGGKMVCTTCHNPHAASQGEQAAQQYRAACRSCHSQGLSPAAHPAEQDCIDCHMPKRRTEDVVHAVVTDHKIQRHRPPGDLLAERPERHDAYRGPVTLYYPAKLPPGAEAELYQALAQVREKSNLQAGLAQLAAAVSKHKPAHAQWYFELAQAFENAGSWFEAVRWHRQGLSRDPAFAPGWQKLGTALRRASRPQEALAAVKRSLALQPGRALSWHELGLALQALGRTAEAIAAIEKAVRLEPGLAEAHNNLGALCMRADNVACAEAAFREAVRIHPSYVDARVNLANLLAATARPAQAQAEFERVLRVHPRDAQARYQYARLLGQSGRYDEAQRELEASLQADPKLIEARELLADLLLARRRPQEAAMHYQEILRLKPRWARAELGLGMALAAAGDATRAMAHLQRAAASADAVVKERAAQMLKRLQEASR